ncbi:MAG: radical SAM protein [Candidatus Omnitrophica bacterium]|nr:radical SAM protein [Candidatus Omnitrophota bacterium]MDE2008563.1 radical SAM protein [Candidatus Omnitrophota bacterium]MDE2214029.1 radical SAM protein [Candidatus Omnitrophota bacterium]MDE2230993.1 radical SAM protein [Candidatus Omnitrophota bacterium]
MILDLRERQRRLFLRLKSIESGCALIGPATVQLQLTDLCNLECQYCWYYGPGSAIRPSGKNHLPYDLIERLVQDCADLQVDKIHLSGVGDPIFHPRFYDLLCHLERSFSVTVYSNATFPIERCRDILRADRIVINLGEADRESYRALVGKDLFMKVIRNIRELARLRPQFNPNFCIEVVFVLNRLNEASLPRTQALVRKLGADKVQIKGFQPSDHNRHMILPDQVEKTELEGEWPACYTGWFFSAIRLNGDVNICIFTHRSSMGNVFKSSFKDIWQSELYTRTRNSALKGEAPFRNYHECINCRWTARNKMVGEKMEIYNRAVKA